MLVTDVRQRITAMFSDLQFDSQRHLYFVDNINYPSTSSKVEKHSPKFNPSSDMMMNCARKASRETGIKVTVDELKRQWQTTNVTACDLGHEVHEFLENFTGIELPKLPQEKAGIQFFEDIKDKYEIIEREIRMYSRKYRYAGTADLLLLDKETGEIFIADYKTNGDLFKAYDFMYKPFQYFESTPYNKYQLQLTYYQIMLEEIGIKISGRLLVYLKVDGTYKIYPTFNLMEELKAHLN